MVSRRIIESSMCLILIRTRRKYILPTITSLRWYLKERSGYSEGYEILSTHLDLLYSNSMCKQSSIPTSILIELLLSGGIRNECTQISLSFTTSAIRRDIVTRRKYLTTELDKYPQQCLSIKRTVTSHLCPGSSRAASPRS